MQTVKKLGVPPVGAHWSMGPEYMVRIGKADAKRLCEPFQPPRMGYETDVAHGPYGSRLEVQNISGDYYLASCHCRVGGWPDAFGVTVED